MTGKGGRRSRLVEYLFYLDEQLIDVRASYVETPLLGFVQFASVPSFCRLWAKFGHDSSKFSRFEESFARVSCSGGLQHRVQLR